MKEGIHPKYDQVEVRCACGNTFSTRSTKPELHLEICSACHPFFTGRQKLIDTEGRVERFSKKFGLQTSEQRKAAAKATPKAPRTAPVRNPRAIEKGKLQKLDLSAKGGGRDRGDRGDRGGDRPAKPATPPPAAT